jgi:hypothetical protein
VVLVLDEQRIVVPKPVMLHAGVELRGERGAEECHGRHEPVGRGGADWKGPGLSCAGRVRCFPWLSGLV